MKLVFPDTETTGLDRSSDEIIELASVIAAILGEGEAAKGGERVTEEELAEVARLDRLATKGPFRVNRHDCDGGAINWQVQQDGGACEVIANITDDEPKRAKHDAAFVARARTLLPRLAAEVRAHRADVAAAAGELLVDLPPPGSVIARLLIANKLLRDENERLRRQVDNAENEAMHAQDELAERSAARWS